MKNLTYAFVLLFGLIVNAQIKFEKGYYINNQNQRIDGYIKNEDWKNNPSEFEFKKQQEVTQSTLIQLMDATEFCVEGESIYKRFEVNIERSTDNLQKLAHDRNPVWKKETLFLKVIVQGKANLYQYVDPIIYKYFYDSENKAIEQLVYIKYYDNQNGSEVFKTNSLYKNQLYNSVRCDQQKIEDFDRISYNQSSLLKQFLKYNTCNGGAVQYASEGKKGIFNLKVTAGVYFAKLTLDDFSAYQNVGTKFSNKTIFDAGLELEYFLPYNKFKWSIYTAPNYSKYSNSKKYTKYVNNQSFMGNVTYETDVVFNNLEIPVGGRYHFLLNNNSKLSLGLAYVFNTSLNSGMKIKRDGVSMDEMDIKPGQNYALSFGYNYHNKVSLEWRYYTSSNILSSYTSINAGFTKMGFVMSYNFL